MRKWTYLVAALLMGGATATFTGCVDTDEPAGIEQLRGAKAALIQAKAEYQAALTAYRQVQVQQAQVDLELKNVTLQIEQLKIAKAQAQNEKDLADLQYQIEQLAEKHKAKMYELQEETATQQEALEKALIDLEKTVATYRDDVFMQDIQNAISALNGYRMAVTSAENRIRGLQADLLNAQASLGDAYRQGLVRDSLKLENALKVQADVLESVKKLTDASPADLNDELIDINSQIARIDEQVDSITGEIAKIDDQLRPFDDAIAEIETKYYKPEQKLTIPVSQVPAAIQKDFIVQMRIVSPTSSSSMWSDVASAPFYNEEGTEMTADYVSNLTGLKKIFESSSEYDVLDDAVETLAENIYSNFAMRFNNAYWNAFTANLTWDGSKYIISPENIKLAQTKLADLKVDEAAIYDEYKADSAAWETAKKNYRDAAEAYGFTYTRYAATAKALTDYWALTTDEERQAKVADVRKALSDYYAVRVPLDNPQRPQVTPTGATEPVTLDVALANSTTYTNAMLIETLALYTSTYDYLGNDINLNDKAAYVSLPSDPAEDGALQAYIRAAQKLWDSTIDNVRDARESLATEEEYAYMIEQGTTWDGSWFTYMNVAEGYQIFSTIEQWMALYDYLIGEADKFAEAIKAIDLEADAKEVAKKDIEDKKFMAEFDRASLDNTQSWTYNNPYQTYLVGKKQSLVTLRTSIDGMIAGINNQYTVYYYYANVNISTGEFNSGYWTSINNTSVENIVNTIEANNMDIVRALDMAKARIQEFDNGWAYNGSTNIANIESQIADAELRLADAQRQLELAEAELNTLLEAYAGSEETPAE